MKIGDSIHDCIKHAIQQYLNDLNGETPNNLHKFFIGEVEKPFLQVVMNHAQGNQSKAASMLGINRNTLRKKLAEHNIQ